MPNTHSVHRILRHPRVGWESVERGTFCISGPVAVKHVHAFEYERVYPAGIYLLCITAYVHRVRNYEYGKYEPRLD